MPLTLEAKKAVVAEVKDVARSASSAIAAQYRGLSVAEITDLRIRAKNAGVHLRVVRNTLARRAFAETEFECMSDGLVGPLMLAFSTEEPGAAARVLRDFARGNEKLVVKLIAHDGKLIEPSDIDVLATLPTREEAIAQLMSVMVGPVTKLVRTLAEPHTMMVRTLAAIRDQRQAA